MAPPCPHSLVVVVALLIAAAAGGVEAGRGFFWRRPDFLPPPPPPQSLPVAEMCPCVKEKSEPAQCRPYDTRYAATTVEEAVLNFPDLSNPDPVEAEPEEPKEAAVASKESPKKLACQSERCRACSQILAERLEESNVIARGEGRAMLQRLGVPQGWGQGPGEGPGRGPGRGQCRRLLMASQSSGESLEGSMRPSGGFMGPPPPPSPEVMDPESAPLFEELRRRGREFWQRHHPHPVRKRATPGTTIYPADGIGTQYVISCTKRGESVDANSQFTGLCDLCWVWRKLPDNYTIKYVNELICDTDTKCMGGYGSCKQRFRNMDVPTKDGRTVSFSTNICCDCQVSKNSGMFTMVKA